MVGAGTMGSGIAQVALEAGHEVVVYDVDVASIERGRLLVREGLARRAAKLDLDADSLDDWVDGRLAGLRSADALVSLATQADIVIEAALELLPLKQDIFRALDAEADADVILGTNTSALRVADIAAQARHRGRILGLHFFNPAPVMVLVEVVASAVTDPAVIERAERLLRAWGKTTVRSADVPGFIVNRVNRPFTLEALAILERGEAGVESIDDAIRAEGFPMGPFELMDLVGIDVNLAASRGVWDGLDRPARLMPSPIQERLVEDGRLGRKTGSGFYRYDDGRRGTVDPEFAATASQLAPAVIAERIILAVVNEAWHALGDRVAATEDIDLAMRLGAAHPLGPFERTDRLGGPTAVVEALARLAAAGDQFVPAPSLRGR